MDRRSASRAASTVLTMSSSWKWSRWEATQASKGTEPNRTYDNTIGGQPVNTGGDPGSGAGGRPRRQAAAQNRTAPV